MTEPTTLRGELEEVLTWLERHAANGIADSGAKVPLDIEGANGWGVSTITDWDIKQRIVQIKERLALPD